jgi:hypothetical protein
MTIGKIVVFHLITEELEEFAELQQENQRRRGGVCSRRKAAARPPPVARPPLAIWRRRLASLGGNLVGLALGVLACPPCRRIDPFVSRQSGCCSAARSPAAGSAQQP